MTLLRKPVYSSLNLAVNIDCMYQAAYMPMPVYTWLESHDFDGKTIIPFCTHVGSRLSGTVDSIKNICTGATVLDGFEICGSTVQDDYDAAKEAVLERLSEF